MFKSKYVKHLVSLVLCITYIFLNCSINSFAADDLTFSTSDFDKCYVEWIGQDFDMGGSTDVTIGTGGTHSGRDVTSITFNNAGNYHPRSFFFSFFKIRGIKPLTDYRLRFYFEPARIYIFGGGTATYDFVISLNYYKPDGTFIKSQSLYKSTLVSDDQFTDIDFEFESLALDETEYYVEFSVNFLACNNASRRTSTFYFSPQIELTSSGSFLPFYRGLSDYLSRIERWLSDIFVSINGGVDSFGVEHEGLLQPLVDLTDLIDLKFDLIFQDLVNFSDSFNTTITDLLDFNLSDILDLSFDNFFSDLFNGINVSMFNINSEIQNSTSTVSSIGDTVNNIDKSVSNIDNSVTEISNTVNNLADSVSEGFKDVNSNIQSGFADVMEGDMSLADKDNFDTSGKDGFDNMSDELEAAEGDLPTLESDDLDKSFDIHILSDLNNGFIAINNIFDEVTSALGFTSVITFVLTFGIGIYLLGRRLS